MQVGAAHAARRDLQQDLVLGQRPNGHFFERKPLPGAVSAHGAQGLKLTHIVLRIGKAGSARAL
jgi:hypothetical protein